MKQMSGFRNKILVVDDDEPMRRGIVRLLRSEGYEIIEGTNGTECISLAKQHKPDLVLLDVNMPDMDGREVCKILKADAELENIFIAHVSASETSTEGQIKGLAYGADAYIVQPISNDELLARVESLLRIKNELEKIKKSGEFFSVTLQSIADGVLATDNDGRILLVNSAAESLTGKRRDDCMGRVLHEVLRFHLPGSRDDCTIPLEKIAAQRSVVSLGEDMLLVRPDGRELCIACNGAPIVDDKNDVMGFVLTISDITARKRAEQEREKLIRDLQAALDEVKTLSGMLPICSSCKKIRDDSGYWHQVENYIKDRSEADFTHGLCPDCMRTLYPDLFDQDE